MLQLDGCYYETFKTATFMETRHSFGNEIENNHIAIAPEVLETFQPERLESSEHY